MPLILWNCNLFSLHQTIHVFLENQNFTRTVTLDEVPEVIASLSKTYGIDNIKVCSGSTEYVEPYTNDIMTYYTLNYGNNPNNLTIEVIKDV